MRSDYADDASLETHLEASKLDLSEYYNQNYANCTESTSSGALPPPLSDADPITSLCTQGSPRKSFTARYRQKDKAAINELEEYFKLPVENFDSCDPIRWWFTRRAQFPSLYHLACDILLIPGKFTVISSGHWSHQFHRFCSRS